MNHWLDLLPHPLHLAPVAVADAPGQGDQGQDQEGGAHAHPDVQDDLSPVLGVDHCLFQDSDQFWSKLVDALLHPEDGDDGGGVDPAEVSVDVQLGHHHVDLEPGLGAQSRPCHILDVKPKAVFLLKKRVN